jgi:hypothetical protein
VAENPELHKDWPKAIHERYLGDDPELASIGKWRMLSSSLKLKEYKSILNVHLEPNGLSKWLEGCDDAHASEVGRISKAYDLVVLYDVIDHMPTEDDAKRLLAECRRRIYPLGRMFALCHPRISRIGTHLFGVNKAYCHLFYDLGGIHALHLDDPVGFYRRCFRDSRLKTLEERLYTEYVEEFFSAPPEGAPRQPKIGPEHQTQFATYILEPSRPCLI